MNSVAVVGIGKVGSAVAYAVTQVDGIEKVVLCNRTHERALANAMDIQDAFPFKEVVAGCYDDVRKCDVVVLCVGTNKYLRLKDRGQEYDESRLAAMHVCEGLKGYDGLLVNVTNPLERITGEVRELLPEATVVDTGTVIDTKRLMALTKRRDSVVTGRHDGEKACYIGGLRADAKTERYVENRVWDIVENKGYTNWAIAQVVKEMIERLVKES